MDLTKIADTLIPWLSQYSIKLIAALLILVIGRWLAGKIAAMAVQLMEKNKVDLTLIRFFKTLIYYALLIGVIIAAAGQLGINTASFLTIVGAAGLAIGLALKDSLSNFASGVMLVMFRPYRIGDFVTVGGVSGKVESIALFNTTLNTPDNQRVIVPNSSITSSVITNVTANDTRRLDLVFGISYDDDIRKAKEIIREILEAEKRLLETPAPVIGVLALADSSVNIAVRPWVKTSEYWDIYFALTEKVKIRFDEENITIPYPQRDVHLYENTAS